ncbi:protein of unknown function [Taphrina deformans PYCC 5710]|uniref:Uncharacterized protein n=1 Tax=Taphrina deformans (strain PYCC 5710 / ATCC 11124 / CBS 356.35 / IMI 108563 / JCM 9778 / NBRC 8474) TaxID=1097556 RepID=R4X973_TAPDE|nr:protein of unknown function [Taphrina deformans PYCC 5710]|eukprot:CCG82225.1 protein of unknown function [Taphrina deformans PYCC 5710]
MHFRSLLSTTLFILKHTAAISLPWQPSSPMGNWTPPASTPLNASIRTEILWKFAPVVYLHPEEAYLPADPKEAYERYYNATADELWVPREELGGEPAQVDGQGRFVDAPMTVQARVLADGRVALQYWYYHHLNGAQGFKTVDRRGRVVRFPWYPLAVHYADWEHTTVVLSGPSLGATIESVYYTVHADINEPAHRFEVEGSTHAVVYSHNNSHACYRVPEDVQNTDPAFDGFINSAVRAITFGAIVHVEVGDIGFADRPRSEWIRWRPRSLHDATESGATWLAWRGHWGPSFDQSAVDMPPPEVPYRRFFFAFLQILYHAGRLTQFVTPAKISPRGPGAHYTWLTLDVFPPPERFIPEDPNGHKPNVLSIGAFIYFLLGFVGIVVVLLALLAVLLVISAGWTGRRTAAWVRRRREQRRREMTERTPLLT